MLCTLINKTNKYKNLLHTIITKLRPMTVYCTSNVYVGHDDAIKLSCPLVLKYIVTCY